MQFLDFHLKVKTTKTRTELMTLVNNLLNTSFNEENLYEKAGDYTVWKSVIFGLEITLCYFSDTNEYYLEGFPSNRVISLIPVTQELKKQTNISNEMLWLFQLAAPEDAWLLNK